MPRIFSRPGPAGRARGRWSSPPNLHWTGLEILATTDGSPFHTEGTVEFRAHFTLNGEADSHHEHSTFTRENGSWVYVAALPI